MECSTSGENATTHTITATQGSYFRGLVSVFLHRGECNGNAVREMNRLCGRDSADKPTTLAMRRWGLSAAQSPRLAGATSTK